MCGRIEEAQSFRAGRADGGEPGLSPELTHPPDGRYYSHERGSACGNQRFLGDGRRGCPHFLEPLYAQAASVMFSLDAWHEPFVPPERVTRAVRIFRGAGGQYCLESAYLDFPSCEHERDKRTNALLADLERQVGMRPKVYQGTILFNGRASERLAHWSPPDVVSQAKFAIRFLGGTMATRDIGTLGT